MIAKRIADDLKKLGVNDGDVIMMHTSIKGLHMPDITPKDIFDGLNIALGESGTLLVPALSYISVTLQNPKFDVKNTESCIGAFPEYFRKNVAQVRSLHPTHSVCAYGRLAKEMTKEHIKDNTPVGENSPFRLLCKENGKILMLGCTLLTNTFMHGVEEYANASYPLAKDPVTYTLIDKNNDSINKEYYPHSFGALVQRYDRIENILSGDEIKCGDVLGGKAYLIDSVALLKKATEKIHEDDRYFVD